MNLRSIYPFQTSSRKTGSPPGTLIYTGDKRISKNETICIEYTAENYSANKFENITGLKAGLDPDKQYWIKFCGIADVDSLQTLGYEFGISKLFMEDLLNVEHLPKIEISEDSLSVILKYFSKDHGFVHLGFYLSANVLITFEDISTGIFDSVLNRLATGMGKARERGPDYLLFLLIDKVVDTFYPLFEKIEEELFRLEEMIIENKSRDFSLDLLSMRKKILSTRRYVMPLKEEVRKLMIASPGMVERLTYDYVNDIQDHCVFLTSAAENHKEIINNLWEFHGNNKAERMNNVMMTLTVVATFFIPLTFIAGIYGMNFEYMPELGWKYSYPVLMIVMIAIAFAMFVYMKKKKWF